MGSIKNSRIFSKQLNHDMYKEYTHHYLREVSTDPPDEVTEILSELDTTEGLATTGSMAGGTPSTNEMISTTAELVFETASQSLDFTTIEDAITSQPETSDVPSESSQTILIVLGILLAVLVIVCCVLACIFAKMRRKGFCTVEGKNQATCDDDCQENGMALQQSPKESMSSGKSENSRSSDKLLTN